MDNIDGAKYNYKAGLILFFAVFFVFVIMLCPILLVSVNSINMFILLFCPVVAGLCVSIPIVYSVRITTTRISFTNKEEFLKRVDTVLSESKFAKEYNRDETGNFLSYYKPFGIGASKAKVIINIYQNEAQISGPNTLIKIIEEIKL